MNQADALDLVRFGILTILLVSGPCVAAAMIVGVVISLLQALTQIQEATLTFVPKIIAVFVVALVFAHYMGTHVSSLATLAYSRIETGF